MVHTDACKIEVLQLVKKRTDKGLSVRAACEEVEIETDGIPAETIRSWYKEQQKVVTEEVGENSPTDVNPQSDNETPNNQDEKPTHGGKRKGAGRPIKKNYNRFWMSVANQINKLCERMSSKGGWPITDNAKPETIRELISALDLIDQYLRGIRR